MERLRVGVLEEDEVFRRGVVGVLLDEGCDCIELNDPEMSPETAEASGLEVAVVCSKSLRDAHLRCPVVVLATPELAGQEKGHAASNVMANLPHEGLTAEQLVATVRAAAAGLQVEAESLTRRNGQLLDPRRIEVLKLLATGATTRAVARKLELSERTVKSLIHDIQMTLGTTTRAQAVAEGVRHGVI